MSPNHQRLQATEIETRDQLLLQLQEFISEIPNDEDAVKTFVDRTGVILFQEVTTINELITRLTQVIVDYEKHKNNLMRFLEIINEKLENTGTSFEDRALFQKLHADTKLLLKHEKRRPTIDNIDYISQKFAKHYPLLLNRLNDLDSRLSLHRQRKE